MSQDDPVGTTPPNRSDGKDRLFRGYGPLIGFTAVFLAIAVLVPSQQREVRVEPIDSAELTGEGRPVQPPGRPRSAVAATVRCRSRATPTHRRA